jgi:tetratricopeptide (TPR) repeat protein
MKVWLFRLTAVLVAVLCSPTHGVFENLGIRNPVGSGSSTVPQSSISDGLVSTPDPFDAGGNLLVTGNVRRGMHFRGSVPYQSPTSFSSPLGSSTLSSFLRDTAGPEDIGTRPAGYGVQPYYSATETVTTMRPGQSEVVSPASAMMSTRMQQDARSTGAGVFGLDASLAEPMSFTRGTLATDLDLQGPQAQYHLLQESGLEPEGGFPRDVSLRPGDAGQLTSSQTGVRRESENSAIERLPNRNGQAESGTQLSSVGLGIEPVGWTPGKLRERLSAAESPLQYSNQRASIESLGTKLQTQVPASPNTDEKQSVATDFGVSSSAQFSPSTVPTLQDSSALPKKTDWPGAIEELKTGSDKLLSADYGDLAKSEMAGAQSGSGDTSATGGSSSSQDSFDRGQRDALEQLRQQLDVLTRSVEVRLQGAPGGAGLTGGAGAAAKPQTTRSASQPYGPGALDAIRLDATGSGGALSLYNPQRVAASLGYNDLSLAGGSETDSGLESSSPAGGRDSQDKRSALDELGQMSRAEIATEARRVMGPHASPESLSDAKFNGHIRAAEEHLRAGRYYQAADSFSLAAVYKPDHLAVLAGKSHALFAAGEYMSSALFLSRALAAFPEYVRVDVDLAALLGGQDKIARRLADIEQWYARSGSGELQFLLSYVYYRTGRFTEAKRAVEVAYQKMPQSPAVRTMKVAIDGAAK